MALAARLAGDLPRLQELRSTLRQRMLRSPLMDGKRFARHVEQAYRQMWRRWCRPDNTGTTERKHPAGAAKPVPRDQEIRNLGFLTAQNVRSLNGRRDRNCGAVTLLSNR